MKLEVRYVAQGIKSITIRGDDKYIILLLRTKLHLISVMGAREAFLIF